MTHDEKVERIIEQLRSRSGETIAFSKRSVRHVVPNSNDPRLKKHKIDMKALNEILAIDREARTCTAESEVTFSDLVQATLPLGLIPMTVPELKTITIGGAVSGCSVESMSYKYGGFHDNCLEYEVLSSDGRRIVCSDSERPDIFHMIHGSYRTLGILTRLKFRLIEAKPCVRLEYRHFDSCSSFFECLKERCQKDDYDFVDGIIHSPEHFVLCLVLMVDEAPYRSSYDWLNIFYRSTGERNEDFLSIYDYFFRYDTECHWLTRSIPLLEFKPVRFLLGKFLLGSTNLIRSANRLRYIMKPKHRPDVVVDVFIPADNFEVFYQWYEQDFKFFPLWIVPYQMPQIYPWVSEAQAKLMGSENFVIDCAVYGKKNNDPQIDYSELIQKKTHELGGIKTLISRNHYDPETFWKIYNKDRYDSIKAEMDPINMFGDLYCKVHPPE